MRNIRIAAYAVAVLLSCAGHWAIAQKIVATPNGVTATVGTSTLQVRALRDDILRVRMWRGTAAPEDASWAVIPSSRTSSVSVIAEAHGFSTRKLRVAIDRQLMLTVSDDSGKLLQQDSKPVYWEGHRFTISKRRRSGDHFFGLGDKPGPLDRSGESFTLWNTDAFQWQESTDPLYKSVPFFMVVSRESALGVFIDNTWRTHFDFGHSNPGEYTFGAANGPIDYYLIYGPEAKRVVTGWTWLTGHAPLPPLWALGFQQSRFTYFPASQLREVADRLRKDRIPTDVLWLDIDFQHNNWPFTVDQEHYPDFKGTVQDLRKNNFKLVVITDLHIARQPNASYVPFDSGIAGDHFLKMPDGSTYVGNVWPGESVFPDFTQARTRKWWGTLFNNFVNDGVAGFWNDMNEPAVFGMLGKTMPDNVQHRIDEPGFEKRVTSHLEIHNIVGLENARATYEGLLALRPNERPFVMTRASYAGGQRYGATWTGDNSATWNHLRMTVPQLLNLGLSGFSFSGADVGGFAGSPSPELLTKWIEIAAFQPLDRIHSAKGTRMHEVWVDGPEHEAIRRRYIEERYRLMPYLYTVAEETSRDGLPMNRPLFLEFPADFACGNEFLVGGQILIAPNPSPEEIAPYEVHLPKGTWYDYWTGHRVLSGKAAAPIYTEKRDPLTAGQPVVVTPSLAELPVYVRGGSILPVAPLTQSTSEIPDGPLTVRVYPLTPGFDPGEETCAGDVYSDDGHSFNFSHGEYARIHLTCTAEGDGTVRVQIGEQEGTWKPWWHEYRVEVVGLAPKLPHALLNGQPVPLSELEGRWGVRIPAKTSGARLEFR